MMVKFHQLHLLWIVEENVIDFHVDIENENVMDVDEDEKVGYRHLNTSKHLFSLC
jgi:hypothetical protein